MGKNQSASNLPNIIQYSNGSINFVSGSTLLMQISSSGAITTTGVISGSNALSSSYSVNSDQLDGFDSTAFVFTSSFNTYSSSMSTRTSNNESTGSTLTTASASFAVVSSSYSTASGSLSTRVTRIEGNYATTGSNVFMGAQTVCANITSTGTIIAQTLNVQQVTSSVVYSSGSNVFGCSLANTQQFTGSVTMTGSLNVAGNTCVVSICSPAHVGGTFSGTTIYGSTAICGAVICGGATTLTGALSGTSATFSGNGIFGNTSVSALNERLNVTGNGIAIEATDAGSTMLLGNFGGADGILGTFTNDNLQIRTNNVARLTIANSGAATFSSSVYASSLSLGNTDSGGTVAYISTNVNGFPATTGISQPNAALRLRGGDNAVLDFGVNSVNTWIQATDKSALNNFYNILLNPRGGNVGIGTTSPSYALDVNGVIRASGTCGNNIIGTRIYASGTGLCTGFTLNSTLIYQDSGGGFNITNPGSYPCVAFTINTSGVPIIRGLGDSTAGRIEFYSDGTPTYAASIGTTGAGVTGVPDGSLRFNLYNGSWSEKMRITNTGNIGINCSDPKAIFIIGNNFAGTFMSTYGNNLNCGSCTGLFCFNAVEAALNGTLYLTGVGSGIAFSAVYDIIAIYEGVCINRRYCMNRGMQEIINLNGFGTNTFSKILCISQTNNQGAGANSMRISATFVGTSYCLSYLCPF